MMENADNTKRPTSIDCTVPCKVLRTDRDSVNATPVCVPTAHLLYGNNTKQHNVAYSYSSGMEASQPDPSDKYSNKSQTVLRPNFLRPSSVRAQSATQTCINDSAVTEQVDLEEMEMFRSKQVSNCEETTPDIDISSTFTYHYIYGSPFHTLPNKTCAQTTGTAKLQPDTQIDSAMPSSQGLGPEMFSQLEYDQGYGSHSTGSSCQEQSSQKDEMFLDPKSDGEAQRENNGTWACSSQQENELEDLVYHFGQFFKDQFDSRFQQYRDDIHALIEAQQNHVRRIVHTAILDQCSESLAGQALTDGSSQEQDKRSPSTSIKVYTPASINARDTREQSETQCQKNSMSTHETSSAERPVNENQLLELMTLSCGISALLAKPQFHN